MHELLEREDKWDVSDDFVLPRLHDLIDGGEIDRTTIHLESAYYDTADHDLQSHGIVLRRRDGDDDTGWQLKVPDSEGRIEIRTSLADAPPSELEELLTGLRLGKAAGQRGDDPDGAHALPDPRTRRPARLRGSRRRPGPRVGGAPAACMARDRGRVRI